MITYPNPISLASYFKNYAYYDAFSMKKKVFKKVFFISVRSLFNEFWKTLYILTISTFGGEKFLMSIEKLIKMYVKIATNQIIIISIGKFFLQQSNYFSFLHNR